MPVSPEAPPSAPPARVAVAVAEFNADVTEALLEGCVAELEAHGVDAAARRVVRVPGAFELPLACARLAGSGDYDAVIALGAVIRGDTPHFDYVSAECCRGLMDAMLASGIPVILGVLTCDDLEQALHRAARDLGTGTAEATAPARRDKRTPRTNKGAEAARAALRMAALLEDLP